MGNTTKTISYSGGNPTNWYNGTEYTGLSWTEGRKLKSLTAGGTSVSYSYDMAGIRSSKTVGGVVHNYVTQNGRVVRESYGTTVLDFLYDASGRPYSLRHSTNGGSSFTTYYYVLNPMGDVMRLINASGTVKASYEYDAWGNLRSSSGPMASLNPLRYRGYFFDQETGWYYLQSRYYDPMLGRFLNADSYASTGQGFLGYNMFAYCGNCPVLNADPSGMSMEIVPEFLFFNGNEGELDECGRYDLTNSEIGSHLCATLSESQQFNQFLMDNLPNEKTCVDCAYSISGLTFSTYSSGNMADIALRYAIGDVSVDLTYSCHKIGGNRTVWIVDYTIYDGYTFEKWAKGKNGNIFAKFVNNCGYYLQQANMIASYEWKCSGVRVIGPNISYHGGRSGNTKTSVRLN